MASVATTVDTLVEQLLAVPLDVLRDRSHSTFIILVNRLIGEVGRLQSVHLTGPQKMQVVLDVLRRIRDFDIRAASTSGEAADVNDRNSFWTQSIATAEALIPVLVQAYKASPAVIGAAVRICC
jgi:hypothetical protein